jgi:maltooligosyltrehalose trehalohydrolase
MAAQTIASVPLTTANEHYWEDSYWINPPFDQYRILELDLQSFTPEGTLLAATRQIKHLRKAGINAVMLAVELINELVKHQPEQLSRFVDSCHYEGIAVSIDVPDENTLKVVRDYAMPAIIQKTVQWFRDFHIDALRLNTPLAEADRLLSRLRQATNELTARTGRQYYLLVDCETSPGSVTGRYVRRFLCPAEQPQVDIDTHDEAQTRTYRRELLYESRFAKTLTELFGKAA